MTLAVVLFCASAAMAKDIRTAVFKVAQMKCENCVRTVSYTHLTLPTNSLV